MTSKRASSVCVSVCAWVPGFDFIKDCFFRFDRLSIAEYVFVLVCLFILHIQNQTKFTVTSTNQAVCERVCKCV